jgi:Fe-S cluster assembly protein SufD
MIYLSQFEQFEQAGAGQDQPWLQSVRRSAIKQFGDLGFPTTRDEDWRHTNVAALAKIPFKLAPRGSNGVTSRILGEHLFADVRCCNLVFINGHFSGPLSSSCKLPAGVQVMDLASALQAERGMVEPHLARHAFHHADAFTALNTAFVADGAFVRIPDKAIVDEVVHLIYVSSSHDAAAMSHPRSLIIAGRQSQVRVVESYIGFRDERYFTNAVTQIAAGDDSVIEHYKLQRESDQAFHIASTQVVQAAGSSLTSHFISLGGSLVRNDVQVTLDGEGSECVLDGLYLARGTQHIDARTGIDHARPHSSSRQLYKGVLDGKASGVFNGRISVRPDAQKTDARQTNKNLLLSPDATVDTKPQLEIYADDVRCTHGATIGKLDEEAMFYLRSRGIGADSARTLLTYAFASEISNAMKIKPIQCQIDLVLLNRLSRDGRIKEAS